MHFQNVLQKVFVVFAISTLKMDYGIKLLIKIINLRSKGLLILALKKYVHLRYMVFTNSVIFEMDKRKQFNLLHKIEIQLLLNKQEVVKVYVILYRLLFHKELP